MGIEEEADRTLFIRNLDSRVTEALLFELFLQAGPLVKTVIPKDPEGKQKSFGFAVYKHEVSVPYAMQLLNGTPLFGRSLHVQFRSGSSHGNNTPKSLADSLDPHGQRSPIQFNSPPYTPPPQVQRSHSSPDNLQSHAATNMMRQLQMQHLQVINSGFFPQQRQPAGGKSVRVGSRQHGNAPYQNPASQKNGGRNQRYADEPGSSRHQQHSWDSYHQHKDRTPGRHHGNRGGSRHHDDWSNSRNYQDNRWRRY